MLVFKETGKLERQQTDIIHIKSLLSVYNEPAVGVNAERVLKFAILVPHKSPPQVLTSALDNV